MWIIGIIKMALYNIIRFYKVTSHPYHKRIIDTGLTLEQAKEHCNDPSTCEDGVYFDGFVKMDIEDELDREYFDDTYDTWQEAINS